MSLSLSTRLSNAAKRPVAAVQSLMRKARDFAHEHHLTSTGETCIHTTRREKLVAEQAHALRSAWENAGRERALEEERQEAESRTMAASFVVLMLMGREAYTPAF